MAQFACCLPLWKSDETFWKVNLWIEPIRIKNFPYMPCTLTSSSPNSTLNESTSQRAQSPDRPVVHR